MEKQPLKGAKNMDTKAVENARIEVLENYTKKLTQKRALYLAYDGAIESYENTNFIDADAELTEIYNKTADLYLEAKKDYELTLECFKVYLMNFEN